MGSLLGSLLSSATSGSATRGRSGCSSRTLIVIVGIILLIVCAMAALGQCGSLLGDLSGVGLEQPTLDLTTDLGPATVEEQPVVSSPTNTKPQATRPAVVPSGPTTGDSWLVMLYQDADDKILEKDIYVDLNEAERAGSTENVRIVSQIDRFAGGFADDGNWTDTRRYLVTQDTDLNRIGSELVQKIGEANMGDGGTLVDFVTWAIQAYPADRYALIMSDHGMGWPGGWSDPDPSSRSGSDALKTIRERTGIDKFELIGLDACLMGQLEVYSTLAQHARYAVASEETEPALGWAYASFLGALARNPAMDGAQLSELIVSSYVREDERIVDDAARADMYKQGSAMGGMFGFSIPTSQQVADQMSQAVTLSAVDLSQAQALTNRVNEFSLALQQADQSLVARARSYAQSFTSVFGSNVPPSYIDLGHFAELIEKNSSGAVQKAAGNVLKAVESAVIAETHGSGKPGATGVAIYFPNSQLFRTPQTGLQSYTMIANSFASISLWDDYLAYHYTGRGFTADSLEAVVPDAGATVTAPGAGEFSLSPVKASASQVSVGETVLLSTDITASNLGYVLLFAGYFDQVSNSLMVVDTDYLEAPDTREVEGVYYPVFPESEFTLEFDWEPVVYAISNGQEQVPATFNPQSYGATYEEAVYSVDGIYTYGSAEGGSRYARLYFMNGALQRLYGFTGDQFTGAPREIQPQTGDSFTVIEEWLDLNEQGGVVERAYEAGGTLTFTDQMLAWEVMDMAAGNYVVGFIARDPDGQTQQVYTQITVR
jgi:hypothetical protein